MALTFRYQFTIDANLKWFLCYLKTHSVMSSDCELIILGSLMYRGNYFAFFCPQVQPGQAHWINSFCGRLSHGEISTDGWAVEAVNGKWSPGFEGLCHERVLLAGGEVVGRERDAVGDSRLPHISSVKRGQAVARRIPLLCELHRLGQ